MEIKQNLTNINYNGIAISRNIKYIVVHYTANRTDTAYNNTKYFKSVNRNSSAHYFVDDNNIYQCVLDKDISWHCGGSKQSNNGGSFYGKCTNQNSIGIEMCCTNYNVSERTENNTIELIKKLMKKYNISVNNVIRHFDVVGKNCPAPMVQDQARWNRFKEKLGGKTSNNSTINASIPKCTGDIIYQSFDNIKKQWLPEIINANDYAGNIDNGLGGVRAKCKNGNIYIQTHVMNGSWLSTISSKTYSTNSTDGNSYSGITGRKIDGVKIWSDYGYVEYRVHLKGRNWLPWVKKADNSANGYAGIYGKEIDAIQMK